MGLNRKRIKLKTRSRHHRLGFLSYLIRGNNWQNQVQIQLDLKRMRKKYIQSIDHQNIEPFFGQRWSCPVVYNSTVKRSRVKNYINSYRMEHADNIVQPNGDVYSHQALLNWYYSIDRKELY